MPRILILGGYGNAGLHIARLLRQETQAALILAGRSQQKAEAAAAPLHATARRVDAADPHSLAQALEGVDLLVNASSTIHYTASIAEAAIQARADYFDIQLSSPRKWDVLRRLLPRIHAAKRCFLTDGGYHPGMPAALIRYAAAHLDTVRSAIASSVMRLPWRTFRFSPESVAEFTQELREYRPLYYSGGRWRQSWSQTRLVDFGPPWSVQRCAPMALEELHELPEKLAGLEETGFYANAFDGFTSNLVIPLGVLIVNYLPAGTSLFERLFLWSAQRFADPPFAVVLEVDVEGMRNGQPRRMRLRVEHHDAYFFTAVPAVACLLQYLDGSVRRPGLSCQANAVEPERFYHDLARLGLRTGSAVPAA
ncbi:MAG: saccharopine dehydrogenase NADP-binding domain-containing protein [Bryobacterales bacterium]|nr:saccharopine dehydrogenase NADP-binding domain-containing protein [Bryobacterales bacterium]